MCDDVLRAVDVTAPALAGVITESLAYSTLQAGPEFARWLAERGPARVPEIPDPVQSSATATPCTSGSTGRNGTTRSPPTPGPRCSKPRRWPWLDPGVDEVVLSGNGASFCSGGDLAEFGTFADPASAHLARTRHSPALALDALTRRLGSACRAEVHGQVLGSGLEMAAFCGRVVCRPGATLGLPELSLGLIPGAGGTVSITRRIGRWRTAYLVLSGQTLDAETALDWGLVDALTTE